jgi:hypothetical protein
MFPLFFLLMIPEIGVFRDFFYKRTHFAEAVKVQSMHGAGAGGVQ